MSSNPATTSASYSGGVEATAITALKAQFASFFVADAVTGVKAINQAALANWLRTDFSTITTGSMDAYDATADVADFAASLTPIKLGFISNTVGGAAVTAVGVATKKAEVEALGQQIDDHYAALSSSSGSQTLEELVKKFLSETDLSGQFPEVVRRIVDPRFYATTWVTAWGEESSPSAPSAMVEPDQNDVCLVTPDAAPPANLGIVGWRLYRSNSGNASSGFQLVPDLALATVSKALVGVEEMVRSVYKEINRSGILGVTNTEVLWWMEAAVILGHVTKVGFAYTWVNALTSPASLRTAMLTSALNDNPMVRSVARALLGGESQATDGAYEYFKLTLDEYPDAVKSAQLAEALGTTTWLPPPEDLRGLTSMANGVMAGYFGNTVCFSEAYTPYAWPVEYQIVVDYPVVAVAAFGQSLFVGTRGSIHVISGSDPSSMSDQLLTGGQSCVSARSVVALDGGVLFASPEGVCMADSNGVKVLTAALFTREDWTKLVPSSMVGMLHDGSYYFMYDKGIEADTTRAEYTLTPAQVIAKTYADIKQVPTTPETNFWLGVQSANSWSNYTLRLKMLETAASFIGAKGYKSQAQAAIDLLSRTTTQTVNDTYTEMGRTLANGTAPTQAEIDFWVFGAGQLSLTNVELRQAMLNAAAFYAGSLDASLANEALRDQVSKGCYALDTLTGKLTQFDLFGTAFYRDTLTDTLYLVKGTKVQALFGAVNTLPAVYRTPVIQSPKQTPMAWLQVDGDWSSSVTVVWYGDGVARHTVTLTKPDPVRLPAGRYREHEIMLLSSARVTKVTLASTTEELQNV